MKKLIITEEQVHALSNIIGQNKDEKLPEKSGKKTKSAAILMKSTPQGWSAK